MVMDVLIEDVRNGSLMELLYTDDLLCGRSLNEVLEKYRKWKNAVEGIALRVNVAKKKRYAVIIWFRRWILVVPVVSGLVIILFSVQNVRSAFNVVVLC